MERRWNGVSMARKKRELERNIQTKALKGIEGAKVRLKDEETGRTKNFILLNVPTEEYTAEEASLGLGSDGVGADARNVKMRRNRWIYIDMDTPCPIPVENLPDYIREQLKYQASMAHTASALVDSKVLVDDVLPVCSSSTVVLVEEEEKKKKKRKNDIEQLLDGPF